MAKGFVDKQYMAPDLVNERKCETTCLLSDPTWVNPRKTSFIQLVAPNYLGNLTSDEYDINVEAPYATEGAVLGADDGVALTIAVDPATIDVYSENGYISINDEAMVIETVDTVANTITVYARGHGGTTVSAHADGSIILTLANVKASCEEVGDCRLPTFSSKISNASQKFDACGGQYCIEDLCKKLKDLCDNPAIGRDRVINDEVEKLKAIARRDIVEKLDKLFLLGAYGKITRADGTEVYTTRGLYSWAYGITDANSVTHSGFVYDVSAEDSCVGVAGDGTGNFSYDVMDRFFDAAGVKLAPQWTHALMTYKTYIALKPFIEKQNENCCDNSGNAASFSQSDLFIDTPYGRVTIVINDHAKEGKIVFFNLANLGWYSDCSMNGNVYTEDTVPLDLQGKKLKEVIEGNLAFDASRNMCSSLAIMEGFTISTAC